MSIAKRYLKALERDGHGRYTARDSHDQPYRQFPAALADLAASASFGRIALYNRGVQAVSDVHSDNLTLPAPCKAPSNTNVKRPYCHPTYSLSRSSAWKTPCGRSATKSDWSTPWGRWCCGPRRLDHRRDR